MQNIFSATVICSPKKVKAASQKICPAKIMKILRVSSARTKNWENIWVYPQIAQMDTDYGQNRNLPSEKKFCAKKNSLVSMIFCGAQGTSVVKINGITEERRSESVKICAICG